MIAGVYSRDLTACGIPSGLDTLTACRMGVMSGLDALPKPQGQKRPHRRALRATTLLKDALFDLFLRPVRTSQSELKGN